MRENWRFVSPFIFIYFALSSSVLSDDVVASNSTVRLPTSSGGDDAVKVVYLHGEKLVDGIVTSKRSIIYNLRLDVQSALDLFRVVVEVKNPKHFKHVNESFLQVYASNGAAGNFLSLPEKTGSGVVLYKNVILLMPLTPQDFRRKGEPKKKSPGVFQALNLVCSTRLHEPVEFQLLIKVLDRSQYDVKLLPDNKPKTVTLTANYVKPIAFRINTTGHYSMLVHVSSEDLICAKLLVFGDEKPLHDSLLNLKMAEKVRSLTFNKRADLYFAPGEMAVTQVINMFIYIDADDVECDPNAASRTVDKEKKIVVTFLEPSTGSGVLQMVFTVLLVMIPLPALLVGMEFHKRHIAAEIQSRMGSPVEELVQLGSPLRTSNDAPMQETSRNDGVTNFLVTLDNDADEEEDVAVVNPFTDVTLEPVKTIADSTPSSLSVVSNSELFSMENPTEKLKVINYPLAIIFPLFMQTAAEYHKWHVSPMANRDEMCFHNFACARPVGEFLSFNHMFSNIGYAVVGAQFVLINVVRSSKSYALKGTYPCVQIDTMIGMFLVMQALGSCVYHICPSDVAFQFDTPFMQIICGLIVVRQWNARRRPPSSTQINVLVVAVLVVHFLVSLFSHYWLTVYFLTVLHTSTVAFIIWRKVVEYKRTHCNAMSATSRFAVLGLAAAVVTANVVLLAMYTFTDALIHLNQIAAFSYILNTISYLAYYYLMKVGYQEKLLKFTSVLGALALVTWIVALYNFVKDETDWTRTPAQSRALNADCVVLDFYDAHDVWHLTSAFAVFFSLLFVASLDDALCWVQRRSLNVF